MAIRFPAELLAGLLAGVMPLALPLAAQPALAQGLSANQPLAIEASPGLSPPACRLLVPRSEAVLQPLRIHPAQVAQKNSLGCLSAADAPEPLIASGRAVGLPHRYGLHASGEEGRTGRFGPPTRPIPKAFIRWLHC